MEILPIGPDLLDAYFDLFDNAFTDNPHWAGCYCAFYDTGEDEEWDTERPEFAKRNRANRMQTILNGKAHGLLAFEEGRPLGWVNAGPRSAYGNLRVFAEAVDEDDPPVGSIMCFVIHPDHRARGVASGLLAAVDDYFRSLHLTVAEAYPRRSPPANPEFPWTAAFYKGSPGMYEKAGYVPHREFEHFRSVRKAL